MTGSNRTDELAAFVAGVTAAGLPPAVKRRLLLNTADTLGVAIGGSALGHVCSAVAVVRALEAAPRASVIAHGCKSSAAEAAFANGVMAHACDYDDAHKFVHPGCVVVPAVLALAEARQAPGSEIVAALAAGYEVVVRVGLAAGRAHRERGFHPTGTCGVFGAAAGAARVLGFTGAQTAQTLGIAASLASGLSRYRLDGSANKHLHAGAAARNGVLAALLAGEGLRGATAVLDGRLGFLETYADGGDAAQLTEGLGQEFRLTGSDIKPYPSCRQSHGAIDLGLAIAREERLDPASIKKVLVSTYSYACQDWYARNTLPASWLEALLRIPYCVAVCLGFGRMDLEVFSDDFRESSVIADLLPKIDVRADESLDVNWPEERPVKLEVELADGSVFRRQLRNPSGSTASPLTEEFVQKKFVSLLRERLDAAEAAALFDMVLDLERAPRVDDILRAIA